MNKFKAANIILTKLGRDFLIKAINHKYYKREGTKGHYKYYYTEKEYNEAKGVKKENKTAKQTETKEFKEWFGNSKVVDKNGKPLRVFHGSYTDNINEFNRNSIAFTNNERLANSYKNDNGKTYKLFLKVENPKIIECKGRNIMFVVSKLTNGEYKTAESYLSDMLPFKNDGIIFKNARDPSFRGEYLNEISDIYFVRNPKKQVKSATGNNGSFDKNSSDITKSKL